MTSEQATIILKHADKLTGKGLDRASFTAIVSTIVEAYEERLGRTGGKLDAIEKKLAQLKWRQRGRRHARARKPSRAGRGAFDAIAQITSRIPSGR